MRRIIVNKNSGRKTSSATRVRARGRVVEDAKKLAKLGRVGMFEFDFTLIRQAKTRKGSTTTIVKEVKIKTDSYDDAVLYAKYNTPKDHQGLIDGQSVVCK